MTIGARTYLVAMRNSLVAQDIKQTIAEFDLAATIIVTADPIEALRAVQEGAYLAFLEPAFYAALMICASGNKTQIIMVDDDPAATNPLIQGLLEFPFTSSEVIALLQRVSDEFGERTPA